MRVILPTLLMVVLAAACGGKDEPGEEVKPPPVATTNPNAIERQLGLLDEGIAIWFRAQPWLQDGSEESYQVLASVVNAAFHREPEERKRRHSDVLALLEVLDDAGWYTESPSADDKRFLSAVFETYTLGRSDSLPGSAAEPTDEYDWTSMLGRTLTNRLYESHRSVDGHSIHLIAASAIDTATARQALDYASQQLPLVEGFLGPAPKSRITLLVVDEITLTAYPGGVCGLHSRVPALIHINNVSCLNAEVVTHELVHAVMQGGWGLMPWVREGLAHFLGLYLSGDLTDELIGQLGAWTVDEGQTFYSFVLPDEDWGSVSAMILFYHELSEVIGVEVLSTVMKAANDKLCSADCRPDDLFTPLLEMTAPEDVEAVLAVIRKWCVVAIDDESPCEPRR